jgi:hypothetical protein
VAQPHHRRYRIHLARLPHAARWQRCAAGGHAIAAPRVGRLLLRSKVRIEDAALEAVQYGAIPLDASKDFYPLGERPRFGDVFYLGRRLRARSSPAPPGRWPTKSRWFPH